MQNFSTNTATNTDLSFSNHNVVEGEVAAKQTPHINTNFNFVADQTPTPTRLLQNCEEVGLFNPFEETFRRAVEAGTTCNSSSSKQIETDAILEEETLHTPQVYPQNDEIVSKNRTLSPTSAAVTFDIPVVEDFLSVGDVSQQAKLNASSRQNSNSNDATTSKYRIIAEKSAFQLNAAAITLQFPSSSSSNTVPVQTVKPFILPKLSSSAQQHKTSLTSTPTEPSSAALTPTSQLPIKERLKAILANNKKDKHLMLPNVPAKLTSCRRAADDGMARKRAAAKRYRSKMRAETEELRKRNLQLQSENQQLHERIRQLEQQLHKQQTNAVQQILANASNSSNGLAIPAQIQIPAATLSVLISLPKMLVPAPMEASQNIEKK